MLQSNEKMITRVLSPSLALCAGLALLGCRGAAAPAQPEPGEQVTTVSERTEAPPPRAADPGAAAGGAPSSSPSGAPAASLPALARDCDGAEREAPSLCGWAAAADGIVFGRLAEVRMITDPMVVKEDRGSTQVGRCDGTVSPALDLVVDVSLALRGEAAGRITVRVGAEQLRTWSPQPQRLPDGSLGWLEMGVRSGGPLAQGQPVGLALHRDKERNLLLGEALFTQGERGLVRFQEESSTCNPAAPRLGEMTLDALAANVRACQDSRESLARRRELANTWGQRPELHTAALCIPARSEARSCAEMCKDPTECAGLEECQAR